MHHSKFARLLAPLALGAALAGCGALAGYLKDKSTPTEWDVDDALGTCYAQLTHGNVIQDTAAAERAIEKIAKARTEIDAEPATAQLEWPYPWCGRHANACNAHPASYPTGKVAALVARCERELPPYLASWKQKDAEWERHLEAEKTEKAARTAAALARLDGDRRSIFQELGYPAEDAGGDGWMAAASWTYSWAMPELGQDASGITPACHVFFSFRGNSVVRQTATPATCYSSHL
jgi:hypothetical protein